MNILIVDTFVRLREILFLNKDIAHQLEMVQSKLDEHDSQITSIFEYLKQLEQARQTETDFQQRKRIGFKSDTQEPHP